MTVKELLKILAGTPGDMEVMLTTGREIWPVGMADCTETSEDGEVFLLSSEDHY